MPVYYNMQNQQKMIQTRQNGQNPHLRSKIGSVSPKFGPEDFRENLALSLFPLIAG